jgi:hypothetical protein
LAPHAPNQSGFDDLDHKVVKDKLYHPNINMFDAFYKEAFNQMLNDSFPKFLLAKAKHLEKQKDKKK